jgi:diacylglycerol kinase (ATP)
MTQPASPPPKRQGLARVLHAFGYSVAGLRAGWHEPAFRQEALLAMVMLPAAFWIGPDWTSRVLLIGSVVAVLVVELLNTAVEAVVDRVGPEWHDLSKRAKDMGSAAVLLSLLLCGGIWASALWHWWLG